MTPNGADTPLSVIDYPTLDIPGHGTVTVKFDLVAQYFLDKNLKMTAAEFGAKLQEFLPTKDASGEVVPGIVHPAFVFDVLSACLWTQLKLKPEELAACFPNWDALTDIVRAIGTAFVKTPWSVKVKLQEPATEAPEQKPN
jgi:hypothetical protein